MTGLVAFISARLDEDQALAQAAAPGPWRMDGSAIRGSSRPSAPSITDTLVVKHTWAPEAAHIVRHDPARVLRDVTGKRATLRRYQDFDRMAAERRTDGRPSPAVDNTRDVLYVAVLDMALAWSDHPDYEAGWATLSTGSG